MVRHGGLISQIKEKEEVERRRARETRERDRVRLGGVGRVADRLQR